MNIQDALDLLSKLKALDEGVSSPEPIDQDQAFIGKHVIVRCRYAGVHAGTLRSHDGRSCTLVDSRRLWYWKNTGDHVYLSGVANHGLHEDSKVGELLPLIMLTETCEIIPTSNMTKVSISNFPEAKKNG